MCRLGRSGDWFPFVLADMEYFDAEEPAQLSGVAFTDEHLGQRLDTIDDLSVQFRNWKLIVWAIRSGRTIVSEGTRGTLY